MKKVFPGAVNEDGTWDTSKGIGKFMDNFSKFPIVQWITDMYSLPFKILEDVFLVLTSYFKDPSGQTKGPWQDLLRRSNVNPSSTTPVTDLIFKFLDGAFVWLVKKFTWIEPENDFSITKVFRDTNKAVSEFFRMVIPNIMRDMKLDWAHVEFTFRNDMIRFGEFFQKIPEYMLLHSQNMILGPIGRKKREKKLADLIERSGPMTTFRLDENQKNYDKDIKGIMDDWWDSKLGYRENSSNYRFGPPNQAPTMINNSSQTNISMLPPGGVVVFDPLAAEWNEKAYQNMFDNMTPPKLP
jgi:hypothetical protein